MMQRVRDLSLFLATLGPIGSLPGARLWASVLGVPAVFIARFSYILSPYLFWAVIIGGLGTLAGAAWYARSFTPEEQEYKIVLDRIIGVAITLMFLPVLSVKFTVFGFLVFHAWVFFSELAQRVYALPPGKYGFVVLRTHEILLLGFFSNALLRFIWWITH